MQTHMQRQILEFWFGPYLEPSGKLLQDVFKKWFIASPEIDEEIRRRFSDYLQQIASNELTRKELQSTPMGALASIVLLDQFPRNMFRGSPKMFAFDDLARQASVDLLKTSCADLKPGMKMFVYLPFEHHENIESQKHSVTLFENLVDETIDETEKGLIQSGLDYAKRHLTVIERFGRFPHRNSILARESSSEEDAYLKSGGETFTSAK